MFETKSTKAERREGSKRRQRRVVHRPVLKPALAMPDKPENLKWYVLKTLPQRESAAEVLLGEMGLVAFNPIETVQVRANRRSTGKSVTRERAILTSMVLFGHPSESVPWFEIFKLSCVTGVIASDGRPALLGPKAIRHLLRRSGRRAITRRPPVVANARASVISGPFTGWEGKVVELHDHALRAIIELDGAFGPIDMPIEALEGIAC